jgi:ABC-type bacteriocin/lantibiotic exporter with double-glycine peptidase domain
VRLTVYQQEQPHTCAVACLRMVAEYFGSPCTEAELLPLCKTTLDGTTPEDLAQAARQLGLSATITYDEPAVLPESLNREHPVIVFLGIPAAPPTLTVEIHAVVVTGFDGETVTFNDPTDGQEHSQSRDEFFDNWQRAFHAAVLITHP